MIVDQIDLADQMQADLLRRYIKDGTVVHSTWLNLLAKTKRSNADFLEAHQASLQVASDPRSPNETGN
ncbi:MAG: hypothetical protein KTU85_08940 [Acidimicrobiia bacterium]|nr:hypothetical protein [Acidimicrobiia bacterium]MCY4457411.1 hypothetical protein [Acidimicrobiaceae bacterium]